MRFAVAAMLAGLVFSVAAAVAASGWTPQSVEKQLTSATAVLYRVDSTGHSAPLPNFRARTAHCVGLSRSAFSCALTWPSPNDPTLTVHDQVFVRPWSTRAACITDVSLGSCPPPAPASPLPNDPRLCNKRAIGDQAGCTIQAAGLAMRRAVVAAGQTDPATAIRCHAGATWTAYACSWPKGSGTVLFATDGKSWTATAVIT